MSTVGSPTDTARPVPPGRVAVLRCPRCGVATPPGGPADLPCPTCGADGRAETHISALGVVVAASRVHVTAGADVPAPFTVVAVRLEAGAVLFARWRGPSEPPHGQWVLVSDDGVPTAAPVPSADVPAVHATRVAGDAAAAAAAVADLVRPAGLAPDAVRIAGVGVTGFGKWGEVPAEALAARAVLAALDDAGLSCAQVDAVFGSTGFGVAGVSQRVAALLPLSGRPMFNLENACAGGTSALLQAAAWLESGGGDVAVAFGVDLMGRRGGAIPLAGEHSLLRTGALLPTIYALSGDRYLREGGYTSDDLAAVVVKSRRHSALNPVAYRREPVAPADVARARRIAEPLGILDCCPNADGAAATVLVRADGPRTGSRGATRGGSRAGTDRLVRVRAAVTLAGMRREKIDSPGIAPAAARLAYELAGVSPAEVAVAEVHDAFSPAEPLAIEAMGLAAPNTALGRIVSGEFALGAAGPVVNPSGGLLSRGHPPAATGLAQVAEIVQQLREEAGGRQADVAPGRVGLVHNQGGSVLDLDTNACSVLVLSR